MTTSPHIFLIAVLSVLQLSGFAVGQADKPSGVTQEPVKLVIESAWLDTPANPDSSLPIQLGDDLVLHVIGLQSWINQTSATTSPGDPHKFILNVDGYPIATLLPRVNLAKETL